MTVQLNPLPYASDELEPYLGAETVDIHYGKHHQSYADKLNKAITGTDRENTPLEQLIREEEGELFNNAAQTWNHTFYWNSLAPGGVPGPSGELFNRIKQDFGTVRDLKHLLAQAGSGQFGSGWAWLALDPAGGLEVCSTTDADNPLRHGKTPLLTVDVWEHAYYLDYRQDRDTYLEAVLDHLLNWSFVEQNYVIKI